MKKLAPVTNTRKRSYICEDCNISTDTEKQLNGHKAAAHGKTVGTHIITISMPESNLEKLKHHLDKINKGKTKLEKKSRSRFIVDCVMKMIEDEKSHAT